MLRPLVRYHKYLIARTEALDARTRILDVRLVMAPWAIPLLVLPFIGIVLRPGEAVRLWTVVVIGVPAMVGMIYAGVVFMVYGIKADIRRAQGKRRSS